MLFGFGDVRLFLLVHGGPPDLCFRLPVENRVFVPALIVSRLAVSLEVARPSNNTSLSVACQSYKKVCLAMSLVEC